MDNIATDGLLPPLTVISCADWMRLRPTLDMVEPKGLKRGFLKGDKECSDSKLKKRVLPLVLPSGSQCKKQFGSQ